MFDCESDNAAPKYMEALKIYSKINCIPITARFELTPLCNFKCPMCYVHRRKDEETLSKMLDAGQWLDLAKQAKEMGVLNLILTGGEIFTYSNFWELYSELNKMGFLISLLSNGYLIDETVKANFIKFGTPHFMKLSLYGASNETYEKMCGVKNGFDRFSNAIDILKELKIPFKVSSTIIKENYDDIN
ncbi:MAG: radical SAM protein, partial [Ruminococcus sp.]|nr:radical SAM protein [Candidatus Copronaster equi]